VALKFNFNMWRKRDLRLSIILALHSRATCPAPQNALCALHFPAACVRFAAPPNPNKYKVRRPVFLCQKQDAYQRMDTTASFFFICVFSSVAPPPLFPLVFHVREGSDWVLQ
jgi:hypothetical protein